MKGMLRPEKGFGELKWLSGLNTETEQKVQDRTKCSDNITGQQKSIQMSLVGCW